MTISFTWTTASAATGILLVVVTFLTLMILKVTKQIDMTIGERQTLAIGAVVLIAILLVGGFIGA